MLAVVGFIVEEFVHLPGAAYQEANPLKAISAVPVAANVQILLVAAVIELATIDKTYGDKPGDLGFDPLSFSVKKTEAQVKDFQLKELKNGRLAMIAFLGMVVQTMLFDKPLLG
ncbi:chlorophyll a/b-binding protein domain-containing protein [Pelagophyceae sp. CCMP2097]|nr:chlorophyll a/b-binding protein domain-containing protein [Pelagophyceae sp. CCMP2097]